MIIIIINHIYIKSIVKSKYIESEIINLLSEIVYDNCSIDVVINAIMLIERLYLTNNFTLTINWLNIYKLFILLIKVYFCYL